MEIWCTKSGSANFFLDFQKNGLPNTKWSQTLFLSEQQASKNKIFSLEEYPTIEDSLEDSRSMDERSYDHALSESINVLSHCLNDAELRVVVLRLQDMHLFRTLVKIQEPVYLKKERQE